MSKTSNMLRMRRRDANLKPNRRLDRKSSRGMLYENEELRLKTMNINAEVERGQSDIKKLKRENDQLRREIWYLRDEYGKLDKLLRNKEHDNLSESTSCSSSSDSESGTSCSNDSENVESCQNMENVQKTKLHDDFDHLSVVPEENSLENSDKSPPETKNPTPPTPWEEQVIKADQSYPIKTQPKHFFSPISEYTLLQNSEMSSTSRTTCTSHDNPFFAKWDPSQYEPAQSSTPQLQSYLQKDDALYESETMPIKKRSTDLIVKTDNTSFNSPKSSFCNGGNLEELLNDIETISHDILKISNTQNRNFEDHDIIDDDIDVLEKLKLGNGSYIPNAKIDNYPFSEIGKKPHQKPYKSELNVVLMPNPMPLIGIEKYKNLQSCESIEKLSASYQNLQISPPKPIEQLTQSNPNILFSPPMLVPVPPLCPSPQQTYPQQPNPFFGGNMIDFEAFNKRYDPDNYLHTEFIPQSHALPEDNKNEAEETITEPDSAFKNQSPPKENLPVAIENAIKPETNKSPKLSIRRRVSIHFKGKKKQSQKEKEDTPNLQSKPSLKHSIKSSKKILRQNSSSDSIKTPITTPTTPKTVVLETQNSTSGSDQKQKDGAHKSTSESPERRPKHGKDEKRKSQKKHKKSSNRKKSLSTEKLHRETSFSDCTDQSAFLGHRSGVANSMFDEYLTSDREQTNSLSSYEYDFKTRKLSNLSNIPPTGKIPWCGCWGNGCL